MGITFAELKQYISRIEKISICFLDGQYDNYTLISDIPDGRYDKLYVYGVGMTDVEFSNDVYSEPSSEMPPMISMKDYYFGCGIEIVLQEEPRDIARVNKKLLIFKDLRGYLQKGRNFSVVMRESWEAEEYVYRDDIPESYNDFFVYGIGLKYDPGELCNQKYIEKEYLIDFIDSQLTKRMVIVLSKEARTDIKLT